MLQDKKFKKSLFGYSKSDVSEYLNTLSEDFSKRLLEQEQHSKEEIEKLKGKIEQLETDNRKLLDKHLVVANALINAERYNSFIKEAVEMEAQKLYDDLIQQAQRESEKLKNYKSSINQLREMIGDILGKVLSEIDSIDMEVEKVDILDFEEVAAVADDSTEEDYDSTDGNPSE